MGWWEERVSCRSTVSSFVQLGFGLSIEKRKSWNTHIAKTALLFLHTLSLLAFTAIRVSQDFSICFQPTAVQVSALCIRRTDIIGTVWWLVHCYRLAHSTAVNGKKSRCVSKPHPYTAHITHSVSLCLHKTYTFFAGYEPKYNAMNRWNLRMRSGQVMPIPPGWDPSRTMRSSSLPALPITSDLFCRPSKEEMKTLSWEWNLRNWAPETQFLKKWHAANSKSWTRTLVTRYSFKVNNSKSQSENIEHSHEMPSITLCRNLQKGMKFWRCKKFKSVQNRYEGRMEENERRVAHMIGSAARVKETFHVTRKSSTSLSKRKRNEFFV